MKVLIDTNVLLSAALRDRLPERIVLSIATDDAWSWLVTDEILSEYRDVLRRPKFNLDDTTIEKWMDLIAMRTVHVGNPPTAPEFPRDPSDAPFLAAAILSDADLLVTGDRDLLEARSAMRTRAVTSPNLPPNARLESRDPRVLHRRAILIG